MLKGSVQDSINAFQLTWRRKKIEGKPRNRHVVVMLRWSTQLAAEGCHRSWHHIVTCGQRSSGQEKVVYNSWKVIPGKFHLLVRNPSGTNQLQSYQRKYFWPQLELVGNSLQKFQGIFLRKFRGNLYIFPASVFLLFENSCVDLNQTKTTSPMHINVRDRGVNLWWKFLTKNNGNWHSG